MMTGRAGVAVPTTHADVVTTTAGLFLSDIEGSTRLVQQLGAEFPGVLLDHHAILREAFAAHDGVERGNEGDSFFVTFPTAADAIGAALDAQRSLARHAWPADAAVRVRIGVHFGEIQIVAGNLVGLAIHEAARISSAGHGGQILLSARAVESAGPLPGGVSLVDLGTNSLKDINAPMRLFQLAHQDLVQDFPPPRSHDSGRNNLPAQTSAFIGRRDELRDVQDLLRATRLLTITGSGGVGKSRLALRSVADQGAAFPDGVWFVDLTPVLDDTGVVAQIVATVGLADSAIEDLAGALGTRRLLVLLDNCEHLVEQASRVVDDLLRRCPGLTIVATSREPLDLPGEVTWRVPSLDDTDATTLFCARAKAVNSRFELTDANRGAVADIVDRLDAIPLALELAAARLGSLSVEQVSARLDQRFGLLTGGARGAVARQRTLLATVEWSHDLLEPDARTVLRRLGVFVGGFTLEAAEVVCVGGAIDGLDMVDHLHQLVAKSLVVADEHRGQVRYRLLETIRAFALDRLVDSGSHHETRDGHLSWVRRLVTDAESAIWFGGDDEAFWLDQIDDEHRNVRAGFEWALERGTPGEAADILVIMYAWFLARGRAREGLDWCTQLQASDATGAERAPIAFVELLLANNAKLDTEVLIARVRRDAAALAQSSRPWLEPIVTAHLAGSIVGDDEAARASAVEVCEAAVARARPTNATALGMTLQGLSWACSAAGDIAAANSACQEALLITSRAGLSIGESRLSGSLAELALEAGDLDTAWRCGERSMQVAGRTGDHSVQDETGVVLAEVLARSGDLSGARDLLLSLVDRRAIWRSDDWLVRVHRQIAELSLRIDDAAVAHDHAVRALKYLSIDDPRRGSVLATAADALCTTGDLAGASDLLSQALATGSPVAPELQVRIAEVLAAIVLGQGDAIGATRLLAGAATIRSAPTDGAVSPGRPDELIERVRAQLRTDEFEAATAEGAAGDLRATISGALASSRGLRALRPLH